jgi:hypothetical protein
MPKKKEEMLKRKSWAALQKAGLLWWINRSLHLFGWAIAVEYNKKGKISDVYPVRTMFRGFAEEIETNGFKKVTKYIKENAAQLLREV